MNVSRCRTGRWSGSAGTDRSTASRYTNMKRSILMSCAVILAHLAAGSFAHADEASDACDYVSRTVNTFKGGLYRQAPYTFEDEGKIYRGCVVTVVGDRNKVPDKFPPADRAYPKPGSVAASAGWKADREADGPDGTSYRILRGDVFCLVSGSWDGGDPTDPKVIPSPLFLITAQCARTR
jgi:hypothetical protein